MSQTLSVFALWSPPCVCLGKIEGASVTDCVRVSFLKYRDREGQTTNPRRQDANKIETAHSLLHTTLRKQYMKRDDQSLIPRKKSKWNSLSNRNWAVTLKKVKRNGAADQLLVIWYLQWMRLWNVQCLY